MVDLEEEVMGPVALYRRFRRYSSLELDKMDWITKLRKQRIADAESKYGPWTAENFRKTKRSGIKETIPEGVDIINYIEMAWLMDEISEGLKNRLTFDIMRILNILKLNE